MSYTRCQDRNCPKQANCVRYDARFIEAPGQAYFGRSPRNRDECMYFFPFDHTAKAQTPPPMSGEWPKDDQ